MMLLQMTERTSRGANGETINFFIQRTRLLLSSASPLLSAPFPDSQQSQGDDGDQYLGRSRVSTLMFVACADRCSRRSQLFTAGAAGESCTQNVNKHTFIVSI